MHPKDVLGRQGEQLAAEYLENAGFRILDRNYRCADGEIDIVAADRRMLVACEVKTRSGPAVRHAGRGGHPREAAQAPPAGRALGARSRRDLRRAAGRHRRRAPVPVGRLHDRACPGGRIDGTRPGACDRPGRGAGTSGRDRGGHRERHGRPAAGRAPGHGPARGARPDQVGDREQRRDLAVPPDHGRAVAGQPAEAGQRLRPRHRDGDSGGRRSGSRRPGWTGWS